MAYFFDYRVVIISAVIYLVMIGIMKFTRKRRIMFYVLFTLFYIYINMVINYTQFPVFNDSFQRSVLGPISIKNNFNFIPFKNGVHSDDIYNVILTIPFGFLLPMLTTCSFRKTIGLGFIFSCTIELTQLAIGIWAGYTVRMIDINDLIFNVAGAAVGYFIAKGFREIIKRLVKRWKINSGLFEYFLEQNEGR